MTRFNEFALKAEILQATEEIGFEIPTPVQEKVIPLILNREDNAIALAQTGTGKTAAFGLPLIQLIDTQNKETQALILCPTRELCMQIEKDIKTYAKYTKGLDTLAVYGGAQIQPQIKALKKGAQIVVGTPGRSLDLIKRKILKIENIQYLILDEADEMLNMGFQESLDAILENTPEHKRSFLFSATMPKGIVSISNKYIHDPVRIEIGKRNAGAENVKHIYYMVNARQRYNVLKRIADVNPDIYTIVFCRTRNETKDIAVKLMQDGYDADVLHGELSQAQRDYVMNRFRNKAFHILVATDVAARGLDVIGLSHVINYNLPDDTEAYVHRSGRTGRAGKNGTSISIVHSREGNKIKSLEKMVNKSFERKAVPNGEDVCKVQLINQIEKLSNIQIKDEQIEPYMETINQKLVGMSREDLIKSFISVELNEFLDYYNGADDLNVDEAKSKKKRRKKSGNGQFSRLFINLGKADELTPTLLIGMVNDATGKRDIEIGEISILRKFTFFEIENAYAALVIKSFKNFTDKNRRPITVEISNPKEASSVNNNNRHTKNRRNGQKSNKRRRSNPQKGKRRTAKRR